MSQTSPNEKSVQPRVPAGAPVYWRVEGSFLELSAIRQVGFFTWNAQSFAERWRRRTGMALMALLRPVAYLAGRTRAPRLLYTLLRGVTRARLHLLGEEHFEYFWKPRLQKKAVDALRLAQADGQQIVLVGQSLDHVLRPLARHLGVQHFIANRMEFRDGIATGRLLWPVVRPRGPFAWIASGNADGRIQEAALVKQLGLSKPEQLLDGMQETRRSIALSGSAVVPFGSAPSVDSLSVRRALSGKHILLIGVTGFIGKVWMVDLLEQIPKIGKITLLIRRNRTTPAQRRFEKILEESPTLDGLQKQYGARLGEFLRQNIDVVEGDISLPGLGLEEGARARLGTASGFGG